MTEAIGAGRRQPGVHARLPVRRPRPQRLLDAPKHHHVHDATPSELRRRHRITGRRPQRRMWLLPRAGPDVDVAMREVLPLPAERSFAMRERLENEVDGFPESVHDADGVRVA